MGVTCSNLDNEGKILCIKCKDRYKPTYGGLSHRNSCRCHRYRYFKGVKYCIDCKLETSQIITKNCYHCYT